MIRQATLFSAAGLLLLTAATIQAEDDKQDNADKDVMALQGTWQVVEGDDKGTLTFTGNKFMLRPEREDESFEGTFKVDSSQTPRQIEMTVTGGSGGEAEAFKGKTSLGIYELNGDTFKWCAAAPGKAERPEKFERESDVLLLVFKRESK